MLCTESVCDLQRHAILLVRCSLRLCLWVVSIFHLAYIGISTFLVLGGSRPLEHFCNWEWQLRLWAVRRVTDWNYISFLAPLYTPLSANVNRFAGAAVVCWLVYPIMYFTDTLSSKRFSPISTSTWDESGNSYNISAVLNPDFTLNHTDLALYSAPYWSSSYALHFFWGFAASTAIIVFAILFHGKLVYESLWSDRHLRRSDDSDPYAKLMAHSPRVPHSWHIALLVISIGSNSAAVWRGNAAAMVGTSFDCWHISSIHTAKRYSVWHRQYASQC